MRSATAKSAAGRSNPATQGTIFRVMPLDEMTREALKTGREAAELTVSKYLEHAVSEKLAGLVEALAALRIRPTAANKRPARLPLSDELLAKLHYASAQTGLPMSALLVACVELTSGTQGSAAAQPAKTQGKATRKARKGKEKVVATIRTRSRKTK